MMKTGNMLTRKGSGYGRWGEARYEKMKEHGYDCADYNMADTNDEVYTLPEKEAKALLCAEAELARKAGIEISQVHGPWRWPARDFEEEDRKERMEKMKKSIRYTAVLGCKYWVIHPIMPFGVCEKDTEEAQKTWDMNIEFMSELLKEAKEVGVIICFENMPMLQFSLAKPDKILEFVKTINDDNFKICLDTGHVSVFEELSLGEEVRKMGNEIRALHIHDNRYSCDLHLPPYYGIINWGEFKKALKDIGFNGTFSFETLPPDKLLEGVYEEYCRMYAKLAKEMVQDL